jgi:GTPase SAR1 family protein
MRFCKNSFNDEQESTIDAACLDNTVTVGSKKINLVIWDTAGQE